MIFPGQVAVAAESSDQATEFFTSALQASVEQQQQINNFESQLEALEIEYGGFDQRLAETLQGLANAYIEAGELDEASRVLNRQLQLVRTIDGPSNLVQLSIIEELIENDIRRADWTSVAERFEYIYWMHTQNPDADPRDLLNAKDNLQAWYMTSIYLDDPRLRVRSFFKAREFQRENLILAEKTFAENEIELIPWLYQKALLQHQLSMFLFAEDELGQEAREDISIRKGLATNPYMRESIDVRAYLREGLTAIKQMREILSEQGDLEAEAMAMIYEADYQMVLNLGTAAKLYRSAIDKLAEAGIEEEKIADFFMRPVTVPVSKFFPTMDEAIAHETANGYRFNVSADGEESLHLGNFYAWNESVGSAARPPIPDQASSVPIALNETELTLTLSSRGYTRNPKPISARPDTVRLRRDARDSLKAMQFRPRFVDGRWKSIKGVTMTYLVPPKL
jgi:hypothetical protein